MTKNSLLDGLQTEIYGRNLIFYDTIDSTNSRALELIVKEGPPEGTTIIAKTQTRGRGTSGNNWESANPDGLWMSIITYEPLKKDLLAFIPAIAFAEILRSSYGVQAHLKWPNDVLYQSKKLGGILCENTSYQHKKAWVVGVGLNINQEGFPDSISKRAISMYQITGKKYDVNKVFQDCIGSFEKRYLSNENPIEVWKKYSHMIGTRISVLKNKIPMVVTVVDIASNGYLMIENGSGQKEEWASVSDLDINMDYYNDKL